MRITLTVHRGIADNSLQIDKYLKKSAKNEKRGGQAVEEKRTEVPVSFYSRYNIMHK